MKIGKVNLTPHTQKQLKAFKEINELLKMHPEYVEGLFFNIPDQEGSDLIHSANMTKELQPRVAEFIHIFEQTFELYKSLNFSLYSK